MGEFKWKNDKLEEDEIDTDAKTASGLDEDDDEFSVDEEEDLEDAGVDELDY